MFKAPGNSVGERFSKIAEAARKDSTLNSNLVHYAKMITEILKVRAGNENADQDIDIKELVVLSVFSSMLRGMVHRITDSDPKVHHWLPVVYLKGFGSVPTKSRKIRAVVPAVILDNGREVHVKVNDSEFAHPVINDRGYYDMEIENFFSHVEGVFSIGRATSDTLLGVASLASFFMAQSVRNPHPASGFASGGLVEVIDEIVKNLDLLDKFFVKVANTHSLPFSPYVPVKIRRRVDGSSVMCFAVSRGVALVLSDKEISSEVFDSAVDSYRSHLNLVGKENGIIYGI